MRDPGSVWWPLPEAGEPDGYTKTQLIYHSTGDNASADRIRRYFAQIGVVVESTFIVGKDDSDPTLQVMDSTDRADANASANNRAISVEVVNDGTQPWTNWQVKEAIRIGKWATANHPIERRVIPAHDASGIGWHVMFGAPGPWTSVRGKVCPGGPAIAQLKNIIIPAIIAGLPEDEVTPEDVKAIATAVTAMIERNRSPLQRGMAASEKAVADLAAVAKTAAHTNRIVGDLAVREKANDAAETEALAGLAERLDNMPPVDLDKLAALLAEKLKG